MKQEIICTDELKLVLTQDECAYNEVIDTFSDASYVRIVTFNISKERKRLLLELEALKKDCDLKVISNIPGRYTNYFGSYPRINASGVINNYIERLNPDSFSANTSTFFNFSNHSKIILTDKLAYIGSANFSDESVNSIEAGLIISDKTIIQKIKDEFVENIIRSSEPYYDKTYLGIFITLSKALSELKVLYQDLRMGFYTYSGHGAKEIEIYNYYDAYFDSRIYLAILKVLENLKDTLESYDEERSFVEVINLYDYDLAYRLEYFLDNSRTLSELSAFDHNWTANSILESEYSAYAYDEKLDYYAELASQKAFDIQQDLATSAKDDMDELFGLLQKLFINIKDMIVKLQKYKSINDRIDNT